MPYVSTHDGRFDALSGLPELGLIILAACENFGGGRYLQTAAIYERLRAQAMIMALRHTALRVSDAGKTLFRESKMMPLGGSCCGRKRAVSQSTSQSPKV